MTDLLFAFNCISNGLRRGPLGECASWTTIEALTQAFRTSGHRVWPINVQTPTQLMAYIKSIPKPSLAFAYAEGFLEKTETLWNGTGPSMIRTILAEFGIPSTHSTPEVMQLCRHKHLTSTRLRDFGLPVPHFQVITPSRFCRSELLPGLFFPLFVKPASGGASLGIDQNSIVDSFAALERKLQALYRQLGDLPVIIETYLPGREYTIGVLGNEAKYVLPPIAFSLKTKVRDLENKRTPRQNPWEFVETHEPRWRQLVNLAFTTFDALKASDVIRIDLKEDSHGNPHIIDVNGTPSLGANASLAVMAQHLDISYLQLVSLILIKSYHRHGIEPPSVLLELTADALQKLVSYTFLVA